MKIIAALNFYQLVALAKSNKISIHGSDYFISRDLKDFLIKHHPCKESMVVGDKYIFVACKDQFDHGTIVAFAPGNPPDPG